jgi:hypothetical protein
MVALSSARGQHGEREGAAEGDGEHTRQKAVYSMMLSGKV